MGHLEKVKDERAHAKQAKEDQAKVRLYEVLVRVEFVTIELVRVKFVRIELVRVRIR